MRDQLGQSAWLGCYLVLACGASSEGQAPQGGGAAAPGVAAQAEAAEGQAAKGGVDRAAQARPTPADAEPSPPRGGVTQENLEAFVPNTLKGVSRRRPLGDQAVTEGAVIAHGAYLVQKGDRSRYVNVNLAEVVDLEFERAQFVVKAGESRSSAGSDVLAKEVDGRLVQRRYSPRMKTSEVIVILADEVIVRVSVEQANNPDEAFEWLAVIDLQGIEALAR